MDRRIYASAKGGLTWFEFGLALFAVSLPIGLVIMLVAPVSFIHVLGSTVVGTALIGIWVSALGLKLEHPERWSALKLSLRRGLVTASPPRGIPEA